MHAKLDAIERNKTWTLAPKPPMREVVSTKWIFKTKYKADGSLDKHKARLVARGFSQCPGVDFDETYAPTARMTTIRTVLCLAAHFGWVVLQMDVKSAFLNGEMEKSAFFTDSWTSKIQSIMRAMETRFEMTDLGLLHYFLGFEIFQTPEGIFFSQQKYARSILERFQMTDCRPIGTPLEPGESITLHDPSPRIDLGEYRTIVGCLVYLTYSRPDICYTVSVLSSFCTKPRQQHWNCATRTLQYIRGALDHGVFYGRSKGCTSRGWCDSDWAGNSNTRRSTTGVVFTLGSGPISWSSKRQPTVAVSSTEAEYRAACYAACEAIWLRRLLGDLGFPQTASTLLSCDNQSCIAIAKNPTNDAANVNEWRAKLSAFMQNAHKHELISTDKKDRRHYKNLSQLASQLGLHSHNYGRVIAFSKVPLANYRADLDFKRPVRKVSISPHVHRNVDVLLEQHLIKKGISVKQVIQVPADSAINILLERLPVSSHVLQLRSRLLQEKQQAWRDSLEGQKMMTLRASLPAYKQRETLLTAVANNQVLVVSGETGCGKTTQLPQYILESEIEAGRGGSCNIICTQPRRISAMSVAERVAAERGEPLGESLSLQVGYKVRLEGSRGRDTRLLFCTTGILLRRLILDPTLTGVSHVIVDEIHERGMNEDFLLIVLRDILPCRPDLRVILMSATLNAELFSKFFNMAPTCHIPGFTHPVKAHFLEDILDLTGHRLTELNQIDDYGRSKSWKMQKQCHNRKRKTSVNSLVTDALSGANFGACSYSTRFSLSRWDPESLGFNLIQALLCHICSRERPGAVLVFMTGWEEITALKDKLSSHPLLGDKRKVLILPCHGSMASAEQRLIFEHPPPNVRKIVLATNMAETSITINDVVFVVDCGKAKETSYDALNNTPCLLPSWISKASARQRKGRAGRVQPGEAYHIYPKAVFDAFADYQQPELHRVPLHSLCLQIKSLKLGSIEGFLSKAMQPPEPLSVKNAIHLLKTIGALDDEEELTHLGRHLSAFPVEPTIGKMLVMGSIFGCGEPVLTIAAGLTLRDPFVSPFDKRDVS
ncbi:hypothetical protein L7F22_002752 [Adiantum nelumboides]|nr:hypothetical protein [Adiantum nelumboides]